MLKLQSWVIPLNQITFKPENIAQETRLTFYGKVKLEHNKRHSDDITINHCRAPPLLFRPRINWTSRRKSRKKRIKKRDRPKAFLRKIGPRRVTSSEILESKLRVFTRKKGETSKCQFLCFEPLHTSSLLVLSNLPFSLNKRKWKWISGPTVVKHFARSATKHCYLGSRFVNWTLQRLECPTHSVLLKRSSTMSQMNLHLVLFLSFLSACLAEKRPGVVTTGTTMGPGFTRRSGKCDYLLFSNEHYNAMKMLRDKCKTDEIFKMFPTLNLVTMKCPLEHPYAYYNGTKCCSSYASAHDQNEL